MRTHDDMTKFLITTPKNLIFLVILLHIMQVKKRRRKLDSMHVRKKKTIEFLLF